MKLTIILLALFQLFIFGQNWTQQSTVPNFSINAIDKIESYTNSDGNHLIINNDGIIKYLLLNTNGNSIRQRIIDSEVEFSNYTFAITGYQNEVYIVYQKANKIKVAKSTSAGDVWDYSIPERTMTNSLCNGIDAVYDDKGLHVVWATQNGNYFQTYYERYRRIEPAWIGYYNVSDFWWTTISSYFSEQSTYFF